MKDQNGIEIRKGAIVLTALDGVGIVTGFTDSETPSAWIKIEGRKFPSAYFARSLTVLNDDNC